MKKLISIFAVIIAMGFNVNQAYAKLPGEVTIEVKGDGGVVISRNGVKVCPIDDKKNVCLTIVITPTYEIPYDDSFVGDFSRHRVIESVTPIYLDNNSVLLINDATGELIGGQILDIRVFDSTSRNLEVFELPSLIDASMIEPGSMLLIAE